MEREGSQISVVVFVKKLYGSSGGTRLPRDKMTVVRFKE